MSAGVQVIVNPKSGGGASRAAWEKRLDVVRKAFEGCTCVFTERQGHATEIARAALKAGAKTVIAVGGDGTLNEVVNGFFDAKGNPESPDAELALLPAGTGGDFRRSVGLASGWDDAVRHVAATVPRIIDVGRIRFRAHDGSDAVRYFINVGSLGVSGVTDAEVNRMSKRLGGKLSFYLGSVKALAIYSDRAVTMSVDGGVPEAVKVTCLSFCKGRFFGGGMMVSPTATLDSGLLHATLWSGYGLMEFLMKSGGLYSGAHATWAKTRTFTAREVRVEGDTDVLLDVDGEQPGTLPAIFGVVPGAVRFRG